MNSVSIPYEFTNLCGILDGQVIEGLKFTGTAILTSNFDYGYGDPHEFFCESVELAGENIAGRRGLTLREKGVMNGFPSPDRAFLYKIIAAAVEADEAAQEAFSEQVNG